MAKPKSLSAEEKQDVKLASNLILNPLLSEQGLQGLQQVVEGAADLPAALGQAIFSALDSARSQLDQRGIDISTKAWTAGGGVLDTVIQEVAQALAGVGEMQQVLDPAFLDAVKNAVLDLMEEADGGGMTEQQPMQPAGPPPGLLAGGM